MEAPRPAALAQAFGLQDRHVLITGGGSGIGLGMAQCFAAAGARMTIVGRREEPLRAACARLGAAAAYVAADVTAPNSAASLVAEAERQNGPLAVLVNNAGIHLKKPAVETTDAEFQAVVQTHVFAAFSLAREAAKGMLERGEGGLLFTASMTSVMGMPGVVAYAAAKSAYLGLVRSLATEWGASGLRVNAIAPGWIQSDMLDRALAGDPARKARILARTPMARFGAPEDIGWAAVYLSSPAAKFVNGVLLPVDGGAASGF